MNDFRPIIPAGKLGEKYVKIITNDTTMTVEKFADQMSKRAEKRKKEIDELIKDPFRLHKQVG